ncbi:achaete-scute homolog 1a-like [Protopterus annectens]|uniref:achaete-scute homolog 1a-like n=1 Tax=Protopterus annectens TaxID=7888 RepID=UPI001CF9DDCE|nr:achaete-scute homolog 1a-like [Protopterus annectens]
MDLSDEQNITPSLHLKMEHTDSEVAPKSRRRGFKSPQRYRCQKRRASTSKPPNSTSERRNERERNRVKLVNMGFAKLRQHVPQIGSNKKMSKVETLRSAVEYIRALQSLLESLDDSQITPPSSLSSLEDSGSASMSPGSACSYSSEEGSPDSSNSDHELLPYSAWLGIH